MCETPPWDLTAAAMTVEGAVPLPVTREKMIHQAQCLMKDVVSMLRKDRRRCKDAYWLHFPELYAMINNDAIFFKIVRRVGRRNNIANVDLSDLLLPTKKIELVKAARISAGCDITDEDLGDILGMCDNILVLISHRAYLNDFLSKSMKTMAPNLSGLMGIKLGPHNDMINQARSLVNTVQQPECRPSCSYKPASSVQISQLDRKRYADYHSNLSTLANCAALAKSAVYREGSLLDDDTAISKGAGSMRPARMTRKIREHVVPEQTSENEADDEASESEVDERPSRKDKKHN